MSRAVKELDWLDGTGAAITCTGKLRVLRENEEELRQVLSDACKDALLMDVDPQALRQRMEALLDEILTQTEHANGYGAEPDQEGGRP